MSNEPQRVKSEGLHFGHLGAIALCAVVLVFVSWMKSGFHFDFPSSADANNTPVLTYEQASNQVLAENGDPNANATALASADNTTQDLAMLDPGSSEGAVLGTSTVAQNMFPDADQMVTPQMMDQIKVQTAASNDAAAVQGYADELTYVESTNDALGMVANLNSQDPAALKQTVDSGKKIVAAMAQIPVPQDLVQYHKLKMMYYTTLGYIAQNLDGENTTTDMNDLTNIMFSLTEKLDSLQGEIATKYNVQL